VLVKEQMTLIVCDVVPDDRVSEVVRPHRAHYNIVDSCGDALPRVVITGLWKDDMLRACHL